MQDAHATGCIQEELRYAKCMCAKDVPTDMYGEKSVLSILIQGGIRVYECLKTIVSSK